MGTNDTLKKLINEQSVVPMELDINSRCLFSLIEVESDYALKILNPPDDTIVVKCDKFPDTKGFFRGDHKECKRADYIVFSGLENTILIIELKRSKNSSPNSDIVAQLKGAKCVVDYCESIAACFLNEQDIFKNYTYRYYKYLSAPQKRSFSKSQEKIKNDIPERARVISGKSIQFLKLLK